MQGLDQEVKDLLGKTRSPEVAGLAVLPPLEAKLNPLLAGPALDNV